MSTAEHPVPRVLSMSTAEHPVPRVLSMSTALVTVTSLQYIHLTVQCVVCGFLYVRGGVRRTQLTWLVQELHLPNYNVAI